MGKRDEGLREWVKREDHIWFANFPSTEEMFRRVNTVDRVPGASTSSRSDDDLSWYGHMTYDKAIEAATKGWLDGAEQVKAASRRVRLDRAIMLGQGRKLKRKVAGSRVDLTAYNQRIPEHMIAKVRVRTNDGTIIRVGVDCGALGDVTGEAMMKRAVAIATVVNAIESTGVACEVMALHSVTFGNKGGGDMATVAHVTKKAAYPVNLERLAFGMGHPSVHRRGVFGVRERFPVALMEGNWWGWWFSGYGGTRTTTKSVTDAMGIDYHIPCYREDGGNWASASDEHVDEWCVRIYNEIFAAKMKTKGAA